MLIFVLSDLLWQPDYSPRIEVGLPQMNLDAPRLLAHCFLYELDSYLNASNGRDFVRFMDDINIGVVSVIEARRVLQAVDLVLQTRQVRLNSGKTQILTQEGAAHHFRIKENMRLDTLKAGIERRIAKGRPLTAARTVVARRLSQGLRKGAFDDGNGDKVLKRWIGLAAEVQAQITPPNLSSIILRRPSVREKALSYVKRMPFTPARAEMLVRCVMSGHLVDDAGLIDIANGLVETLVPTRSGRHLHLMKIIEACDVSKLYSLYCRVWLQSKYDAPDGLLQTIRESVRVRQPNDRIGRLVGSFAPLFVDADRDLYFRTLVRSGNVGARAVYAFHRRLSEDKDTFNAMFAVLRTPNVSKGTGITHAKYLCLLSALNNRQATASQKANLRGRNSKLQQDIYYRRTMQRVVG